MKGRIAVSPIVRVLIFAVCAAAAIGVVQASGQTAPAMAPLFAASGDPSFDAWRADFAQRAVAGGRDPAVVRALLEGAAPDPAVIKADRNQPEFVRPTWDYLDRAVSADRLAAGKAALAENDALFHAVGGAYGVDPAIIAGIWALETNFGAAPLPHHAPTALATLAAEGRRRAQFEGYLLALIQMVERGYAGPAELKSSWAGALGQPQFMPDVYLKDSVDWDGDGRRDIWTNRGDVFASIANYLKTRGWAPGQPVFDEARLPAGFDYGLADGTSRPVADWHALGVTRRNGALWPAPTADLVAQLYLPAGAEGPALLLFPNFAVIRRYNPSDRYALAIALLARGFAGRPGIEAAWPRAQGALQRDDMLTLQTLLAERGHDPGVVDGLFGQATRTAVRGYQRSAGLPADGWPTPALLERLRAEAGLARLQARLAAAKPLDPAGIRALQATLQALGHTIGKPTGTVGPRTRAAIEAFEIALGLAPTAAATDVILEEAQAALKKAAPAKPAAKKKKKRN